MIKVSIEFLVVLFCNSPAILVKDFPKNLDQNNHCFEEVIEPTSGIEMISSFDYCFNSNCFIRNHFGGPYDDTLALPIVGCDTIMKTDGSILAVKINELTTDSVFFLPCLEQSTLLQRLPTTQLKFIKYADNTFRFFGKDFETKKGGAGLQNKQRVPRAIPYNELVRRFGPMPLLEEMARTKLDSYLYAKKIHLTVYVDFSKKIDNYYGSTDYKQLMNKEIKIRAYQKTYRKNLGIGAAFGSIALIGALVWIITTFT